MKKNDYYSLQNINRVLVSTVSFDRSNQHIEFSENAINMFKLEKEFKPKTAYSIKSKEFLAFKKRISNFEEMLTFLMSDELFSTSYIDIDVILDVDGTKYSLEGCLDGDICHLIIMITESNTQVEVVVTHALINAKIGLWWAEKVDEHYRIFHTTSSRAIYGSGISSKNSRQVFSDEWQDTVDEIIKRHPEYDVFFENNKKNNELLINGEIDSLVYDSPWINTQGDIIWVEDRVSVLNRTADNMADLIVGVTLDITERKLKEFAFDNLESINKQLVEANEKTIKLTSLMVWKMEYHYKVDNPFVINDLFRETLGLKTSASGVMTQREFIQTIFPDKEGSESFHYLIESFEKVRNNEVDDFSCIIKHQNLQTKQALYLEHRAVVEERNPDGTVKLIGGYTKNVTDKYNAIEAKKSLGIEKEKSTRATRLAVRSGRMMLWYLDGTETDSAQFFYGNQLLFSKLGLTEFEGNKFKIEEFNRSIYDGDKEGRELKSIYFKMDDRVENNEIDSYDKLLVKHQNILTNEIFYFEHNFEVETRFPDGSLNNRGGFMVDVTTEINLRKSNEFLIDHDSMTGLMNRNAFEKFIRSPFMPKIYTLIISDIDGLKFINDAFGHLKGDDAILFAAQQLQSVFESCSRIYRIGGDEFAIISKETDESYIMSKIDQIRENIAFFNLKNEIQVGVSFGYEIVKNRYVEFSDIFTAAENLMYRHKLKDRNSRKSKTMDAILETLHVKTEETKEHCDRLGDNAKKTLKRLGFTRNSDQDDIEILCQVHDIGKITISEEILSKRGKLSEEEYTKIKSHSEAGYKIIKNIVDSDNIALGVLFHHEKVDGTGYPFGLKGDDIPIFAKVVSICDAYDVMVSGRKYSKAMSIPDALAEILRCSGTQFDEKVAKVFIEMIQEDLN